jgi:hypothetical protein
MDHRTLHGSQPRYINSLIIQLRTGCIGLQAFLFSRRVPEVTSPRCPCGNGRQTVEHVFTYCTLYDKTLLPEPKPRDRRDVGRYLGDKRTAPAAAIWYSKTVRPTQFRLAIALQKKWEAQEADEGGTRSQR